MVVGAGVVVGGAVVVVGGLVVIIDGAVAVRVPGLHNETSQQLIEQDPRAPPRDWFM